MKLPIVSCSNYDWFYFLTAVYTGFLQVAEEHLKMCQGIFLIKASGREELCLGPAQLLKLDCIAVNMELLTVFPFC